MEVGGVHVLDQAVSLDPANERVLFTTIWPITTSRSAG
jgi:hypothetical protein